MTNKIEIVKPVIIDGIEFYVSSNGEESGISQVGLARLCGVGESTMRALLTQLVDRTTLTSPQASKRLEKLKHLQGIDLAIALSSNQQAVVIKDEYAGDIIRYFSDRGNETATYSLRKFNAIGIRTWIKDVTGHSTGGDQSGLQATLGQILDQLTITNSRLTKLEQTTGGYRKAVVTMPGLAEWMAKIDESESEQKLLPDAELFTLAEYLWETKKLKFEKPAMSLFSNKVSYVFKTVTEQRPERKHGVSVTGYKTPLTNAYRRKDFPLLDIAFKQTVLEL
jgi:hypothetical protein